MQTRAPGRVNLIGEHTDYNDGFVLPCAISYDTYARAAARSDRIVTVRSSLGDAAAFELDRLPAGRTGSWSDYVWGVLAELERARPLRGADLSIGGTVPIGAGLSSSASFEIAVALALLALADAEMPPLELARLAQRAEIGYVGTRCGIMDQFTVLFAREGHALLLDTRTLAFETIPVPGEAAIVICNTMVKHDLAASAYNERREQCERAVALMRERGAEIRALRDVRSDRLDEMEALLPKPLFARARHVVTENERVIAAAHALRSGNLEALGRLMNESHESLRADYEVSCTELDTMVRLAQTFDGVFGARMTGGGFGGCTVNVVRAERAAQFREYITGAYRRETGIELELYDGTPSAGACVIRG